MSWFDWLTSRRPSSPSLPWNEALNGLPILQGLEAPEQQTLCELAQALLARKTLTQLGVSLSPLQQASLALQAVLPVLHLGLDWYAGFHEIILIPEPVTRHETVQDEYGLVSEVIEEHAGESWQQGPLVLAWSELADDGGWSGYNLIIHELAHKLDMLGGEADGVPPMRPGMNMSEWRRDLQVAFDDLRVRAERHEAPIDPYAATHPAEFLAVTTELFFTAPRLLHITYPAVYCQLTQFFGQSPLERQPQDG
ncbi:zinc-dependent peptidase [Oceanimonas baumannii]|uniref:M90 family metallopeptidase n=1 Tax=Oceanimonas baumannii TaxID=129578 RepID=UPI003A947A8F